MSASASLISTLYPCIYNCTPKKTSTHLSLTGISQSRSIFCFNGLRRCTAPPSNIYINIYPPLTNLSIKEKGVSPSSMFLVFSAMKLNSSKITNSSNFTFSFQAPPADSSAPATSLQTLLRKIALLIPSHVGAWQEGREVKVLLRILPQTRLHSTHENLEGASCQLYLLSIIREFGDFTCRLAVNFRDNVQLGAATVMND